MPLSLGIFGADSIAAELRLPLLECSRTQLRMHTRLEVLRKGQSSPFEKRRERHEASEAPRNVRLYMSRDERRFVARSSFSDGLRLRAFTPVGTAAESAPCGYRYAASLARCFARTRLEMAIMFLKFSGWISLGSIRTL